MNCKEISEFRNLFDKQTRQESRLTVVDINLKNGVYFYKIIIFIFISNAAVVIILWLF